MHRSTSTILLFSILIFLFPFVHSQELKIKHFGVSEGICHPFVYTINQDSKGYLWLGTGEGLCRFDGIEFKSEIPKDSLAGEVVVSSFKDPNGNLWFGYNSGNIVQYTNNEFKNYSAGTQITSSITGFADFDNLGLIVSTLSNGLFSIDYKTGKKFKLKGIDEGIFTALLVQRHTVLLGTQDGLAVYELQTIKGQINLKFKVKELEYTKIQDIQISRDGKVYWIATEDKGCYRLSLRNSGYSLSPIGEEFKIADENTQSVFEDSDKNLWISTLRDGVFKLTYSDKLGKFTNLTTYNKVNGLPGNSIKKTYEDEEGNIWIATYGDGLALLTGQAFSFYDFSNAIQENDIQSVATSGEYIYLGSQQGLFRVNKSDKKKLTRISGLPHDKIGALYTDNQDLWIGTDNNGLYRMNINTTVASKVRYTANSLGNSINAITSNTDYIYLGTKDGLYLIDKAKGEFAHYTTINGLPYNNIEFVIPRDKNGVLIATKTNGVYYVTNKGEVTNQFPAGESLLEFQSITVDAKGGLWASTYGDGVYHFYADSVYHITERTGLKSDYCYSIVADYNQNVWVGHRLGISRINISNYRVKIYDMNIGITGDCNLNAVTRDKSGLLYFGTTDGLVTYDYQKEYKRKLPPFTNITKVIISDKEYNFNKEIVLPYKLYKLRIEFIGINYTDAQAVTYQYKLDGHDLDWSDVTNQNYVIYPRIEDGEYTFYLKSFNSDGLSQAPVSFIIKVRLPFWKTWWFISLSLLIFIIAIYSFIKIRERKQKQLQEYLEIELAARTKEVVEQKEEIEIKNRDITDSINYARRIQTSMLPPVKRLQQNFSGCFVFYSPRDIVSGDFYWFDRVSDSKFIIVCADSTGHGVPGAFMSMIGSTLIKDICFREAGHAPSQVLQVLDAELRNTLNQNLDDGGKPGDGMDINVCEIDLKTHYVRYASAMRPMIIYRNGEETYIRGSRNSVGGHYEMENNIFEDEGIQLSKGDIIYMFSDGYPDQFGGPMGKKFKMVRLRNLLQDIHQKPMEDQYNHVKNTFNLWKENYDQVDDVLFMGIKI